MAAINLDLLEVVKMVCPSADKLSVIVNNVHCTKCGLTFQNGSRLRLHDIKVHQRKNLDKIVKEFIKYQCPVLSCVYSPLSKRYFTTMKYLKQHYLKVHAAKMYSCTQCDKSFSTEAAKLAHSRVCGLEFICNCSKTFTTYEALLTHAKRQLHQVDEKYKNFLKRANQKITTKSPIPMISLSQKKTPVSILPYRKKNLQIVQESKSNNITTRNMSTQTDDIKKRILSPSKTSNKRRESRQTQTNLLIKEKRSRKTVETQTSSSVRESSKRSTVSTKIHEQQINHSSRADLGLNNTFPGDNLPIFPSSLLQLHHDVRIEDFWDDRNHSGTQTNSDKVPLDLFNDSVTQTDFIPFYGHEDDMESSYKTNGSSLTSLPYVKHYFESEGIGISCSDPMLTEEAFNDRFSSIETQTERIHSQSLFDSVTSMPRAFTLSSNIETQTTEHFGDMAHLLYSNTYTQTCNDILSSELCLSNIQTQTTWPELKKTAIESNNTQLDNHNLNNHDVDYAVESNIPITACRSWLSTQQTSHTETQTDLLSIFDEF